VIFLLVVAVVAIARWSGETRSLLPEGENALDILKTTMLRARSGKKNLNGSIKDIE
jgi:hypothetical protein